MEKQDIENMINNTGHIGSEPDMYHPDYGWIRVDGQLTNAGKDFFKDQLEKFEVNSQLSGRA